MPENNQILSVEGQLVGMPLAGPESFSAQQLDYLKRALGVDETVLYTSSTGETTLQLNESLTNFERIRFKIYTDQGYAFVERQVSTGTNLVLSWCSGYTNAWTDWMLLTYNSATNVLTVDHVKGLSNVFATNTTTLGSHLDQSAQMKGIREIVGIHRISGGN